MDPSSIKLIVTGICNRCGSVEVWDELTGEDKMVPDFKWLNDRGYVYRVDDDFIHSWVSCNACVNQWRVDYCACGSGKPYAECDCAMKEPYYWFAEPEEYVKE